MTALTTLYRSDLLSVTYYDCDHARGHGNAEEAASRDELVFIVNGVYQKRSSDGNTVLDPSRIAIFRKDQPFCISHPADGGDQSIIFEFNISDLCAAFGSEPDASGTALRRVPATLPVTPALMLMAGRLCSGLRQGWADELYVEETAYALLARLAGFASRNRGSTTSANEDKPCVLNVAAVVASRYREKLSIGTIAGLLNVSPFHLCRSFRAATGSSIGRYITTLRMSDAVHSLCEYRNNLTELALDLGYSSHSHFSSAFRQYFGIAPSRMQGRSASHLRRIERLLCKTGPGRH